MHPQNESPVQPVDDQLLMDLQSFLFAADSRVRFTDLKSSFPTASASELIEALAELEAQNIISLSIQHNAVFEKAKRVTQSLKPLQ